jgi:hypothetical protein
MEPKQSSKSFATTATWARAAGTRPTGEPLKTQKLRPRDDAVHDLYGVAAKFDLLRRVELLEDDLRRGDSLELLDEGVTGRVAIGVVRLQLDHHVFPERGRRCGLT